MNPLLKSSRQDKQSARADAVTQHRHHGALQRQLVPRDHFQRNETQMADAGVCDEALHIVLGERQHRGTKTTNYCPWATRHQPPCLANIGTGGRCLSVRGPMRGLFRGIPLKVRNARIPRGYGNRGLPHNENRQAPACLHAFAMSGERLGGTSVARMRKMATCISSLLTLQRPYARRAGTEC